MARISSNLNSCLKELAGLIASDSLARYESEVPLRRWKDELGQLRVWAANIGAHQVGQSSLDYRLRDASHIKDQTVKLLERMRQLLDDLKEVMSEDASEDEHEDIHAGDHDWDDDNVTEIQQIYHNVVKINDHLFKMTMAIRRPARHDQLLGMERSDATSFEPWAQQHVSNKYPHADAFLVNRIYLLNQAQQRKRCRRPLRQNFTEAPLVNSKKQHQTLEFRRHRMRLHCSTDRIPASFHHLLSLC